MAGSWGSLESGAAFDLVSDLVNCPSFLCSSLPLSWGPFCFLTVQFLPQILCSWPCCVTKQVAQGRPSNLPKAAQHERLRIVVAQCSAQRCCHSFRIEGGSLGVDLNRSQVRASLSNPGAPRSVGASLNRVLGHE